MYPHNKTLGNTMKEIIIIAFIIATIEDKILKNKHNKKLQTLYEEIFLMLRKGIKEDLDSWKDVSWS